MEYQYLFQPIQIGPVIVKNRLAFGPACPPCGADAVSGLFDESAVYFYGERAKGGQGLIIIGNTRVSKATPFWPFADPQLFDDRNIPPLRQIVNEVHRNGCKLFIQLAYNAAGRTMDFQQNNIYGDTDVELAAVGPSQIPWVLSCVNTKEMSIEEIEQMTEDFGQAARRAMEAGLDGVEIHSWAAYLHWMFLSPFYNKRQDKYGGSMENRARFLIETLQKVHKYVGEQIAVGYRITSDTLWPGDLTIDEVKEVVKYVNSMVKVDFVNVGLTSWHRGTGSIMPMGTFDPGYQMPFTAEIKTVSDVPIFGGGSINDPQLAEEILAKGQCDVIVMARQMYADPEFANKALEGEEDDIRHCVRCNYCIAVAGMGLRAECSHNPTVGREKIWGIGTLKPADVRKKILIIGGGPAGQETARVARERGHDVVIYEKETDLGGRVRLQARLPRMSEIGDITSWLERQVKKVGVRIATGKEVTVDNLERVLDEESPEVGVIATGAVSARDGLNSFYAKEIPGWQQENVYTYEDVLEGKVGEVGKVLLLDDISNELAPAVAQMLAVQAGEVQLVTRRPMIAQDPHASWARALTQQMFRQRNIKFVPFTFITEINGNSVRLLFIPTEEEYLENDVDAVVLLTMFKSNNGLFPLVKERVKETYLIGDARAPRTIHEAIMEGHRLGRKL